MANIFEAKITFGNNELIPFLSEEELQYHYGKHHKTYANTLNSLIDATKYADMNIEDIIISSRNSDMKVFNNASQVYNHDFYWNCLTKNKIIPSGELATAINNQFGSLGALVFEYAEFAGTMFGSGWSWLILENRKLSFLNTSNAENPVGTPKKPICVIDLWEHAYYIDYRNDRAKYVNTILANCINWDFCSKMFLQSF